jgi:hypothetical protein
MDSHKLIIKFFAEDATDVDESAFVPVFHSLIQTHALPGHLLIDVGDYTHVPDGPGTVLVSHEANVYFDHAVDKRPGLMYQRKQPIAGAASFRDRLADVFASALRAATLLEENPAFEGRLKFRTGDFAIRINDRLHGPNTHETYEQVAPAIRGFLADLYPGSDVSFEQSKNSPLQPFQVNVKASRPPTAAALLDRLAAGAPGAPAPAPSR